MIHPSSDVQSNTIGKNTTIWQFVVILKDAVIGENCNINAHVFIENNVIIGDSVTIKSGVQLWDGIQIQNNVFIGPNTTFTNDRIPRSKQYPEKFEETIIEEGASIGANATILTSLKIGKHSLIGAGAVVTKDIPPHSIWYGNPASLKGYITIDNIILDEDLIDQKTGNAYKLVHHVPSRV